MIEVIKHGKTKFRAVCSNCGCEFTYEVEDIKLGSVTCPDCGDYVAHPNFGNNNGSLYYHPNYKDVKYPQDTRFFTITGTNEANTMGTLLGDVHTTEKDLEIQQIFKDQMSRKMAIPCADYTQDQLKNLQEQLEKDAYHWVSQSTII